MHAAAQVLPHAPHTDKEEPYLLCDGGVVANNPTPEAVAFTAIAFGQDNCSLSLQVHLIK